MLATPKALQRAAAFHRAGYVDEAERCYREILERMPRQFEALHNLGILHAQQGRNEEALRLISHALTVNPKSIEAHASQGNVLTALERHAEARVSCERVLAVNPRSTLAQYNLGNALLALNRHDEAAACYTKVTMSMPGNLAAHYNLGVALQRLGRHDDALASYARALTIAPDHAPAHFNRGAVLRGLGRNQEALASYDRAVLFAPTDIELLTSRGNLLYDMNEYAQALASFDRALAVDPDYVPALNNRGNALRHLDRPADALDSFDRVLAIKPDYLEALTSRGIALQALNRNEEALANYEHALAIAPEHADAHWAASLCSLALGDFARGWREYEWRWKTADFPSPRRVFHAPLWLGREEIRGKSLLVYCEQGLGDTIQFCRYIEMAAQLGARITLEVQPQLRALLHGLHGPALILGKGDALPEFDFQCPLLSLPLAFNTLLETVPASGAYLYAEPRRIAEWGARLAGNETARGFRIGICWQGTPGAQVDFGRSIPVREFLPLSTIPGVRLISLQKHDGLEQLRSLPDGMQVETLAEDFDAGPDAFLDTAAVMQNLDLIITSDTSVAHVAGALGCPVWLVLKHVPDWRWMLERADSPWYPTMRLFRQTSANDWSAVFAVISSAVKARVDAR